MIGTVLLSLMIGCAQKKDVEDLDARLKALEEKVASLDKSGGAARPGATTGPQAKPEDEQAASKLMQDAQMAMKGGDYATAKDKLGSICTQYADTRACKASTKLLSEVSLIGTDAPALDVEKWYQGKASLSDSKATLLVFFEAWCPHCKEEMPKLAADESKFKSKGVQLIGVTKVTRSATDDKVMDFLKEGKVGFPIAKEKNGSLSQAFSVTGIPAAAFIKDGKVVWRGHPAQFNDDLLAKLMAG